MRAILIWASITLAAAIVALTMALGFRALQPVRNQQLTFLVGPFDPNWTFALAFTFFVVAFCGLLIAAWWRAVSRGARILLGTVATLAVILALPVVGLLGFLVFFTAGVYTEIPASAAGRELVVREYGFLRAGPPYVYERDGILLRWIATIPPAGDTTLSFADGNFDVIRAGDHVVLRWATEDPPGTDWARLP
ncbi:hypothetical protein [Pseudolysinimonas yzui]|uniref:hypothetical protein n=1 Tax=Pseudolysinimonas yzui TaxID=2708254 RepID=UPI00174EA0C2|nr:hypothetical protein [Pseudolysinimonas yzui]